MRRLTLALLMTAIASPALADGAAELRDLVACRETPDITRVAFTFEGGACDKVTNSDIELTGEGRGRLWVETETEGEVCTMQIVPIAVDEEYELERSVTALDVEAYNPAGGLAGRSSIDIAESC